jgi:hypothetical protein
VTAGRPRHNHARRPPETIIRSTLAAASLALIAAAAGCGFGSTAPRTADLSAPHPCLTAAYPAPDPNRPRYTMQVQIDPAADRVRGRLRVIFTPDIATDRLVFRLWPNGGSLAQGGTHLSVGAVAIDGHRRPSQLSNPTTLVVPGRFAAGAAVTASLPFQLALAGPAHDRISQSGDAIRLGSFYPILPWQPGIGWALEPPSAVPSETSTSPVADYQVTVRTPAGLQVVASGTEIAAGHWRAEAVRDFAIATGHLQLVRRVAHAPGPVNVTVALARGVPVDPQEAADEAVMSIEHLAQLYGPYPWASFTIAYGPALESEGIEYPTLVFEGPDRRRLITAHEVAHQWFYSLVGNDQARDPWLDEAFASWTGAETSDDLAIFATVPIPDSAGGHLGAPMTFWGTRPQEYSAGVYAQGVQALQSLGSSGRIECALRRYVARNAYRIATDEDALAALSSVFPDARSVFARYGVH